MGISVNINGELREFEGDEPQPLVLALRNELGLRGVRFGCGGEDCGACTVLIDGEPRFSCTLGLDAVAGRDVVTLEGLQGRLGDVLRSSFIEARAGQCGYCLSGIFTSAYALLERTRKPSREEILKALQRHLCRCGSHASILRAIERAAGLLAEERS
jgi:nicotinate dehydrogenase subunit A